MRSPLVAAIVALLSAAAAAADWTVHATDGNDAAGGDRQHPLATIQRAVERARPGDTIHLQPDGAVFRQTVVLVNRERLTIDGHGGTLTGADPLPADGWESAGAGLWRRNLPRTTLDRHLLIRGGKACRMGRSPTVKKDFPPPERLREGEFCWQPIDDRRGWLYVRGDTRGLEWSVRMAGVQTSRNNRDITIRNLHCRHTLNDGFNIHGDCRNLRCTDISGYENFDEGFSAHETATCWIERGRFWANDNAVADVNQADSYYRNCEFRDSVNVEVFFQGGRHEVVDSRISATGAAAVAISPGFLGKGKPGHPVSCVFRNVVAETPDRRVRPVLLTDATVLFDRCRFARMRLEWSVQAPEVRDSALGPEWTKPPAKP